MLRPISDEYLERLEDSYKQWHTLPPGDVELLLLEVRRLKMSNRVRELARAQVMNPLGLTRPSRSLTALEWAVLFGIMLGFVASLVLLLSVR